MRKAVGPLKKSISVFGCLFRRLFDFAKSSSKTTSQPARGLSVFTGTSAAESERSLRVLISLLAVFACGAR